MYIEGQKLSKPTGPEKNQNYRRDDALIETTFFLVLAIAQISVVTAKFHRHLRCAHPSPKAPARADKKGH